MRCVSKCQVLVRHAIKHGKPPRSLGDRSSQILSDYIGFASVCLGKPPSARRGFLTQVICWSRRQRSRGRIRESWSRNYFPFILISRAWWLAGAIVSRYVHSPLS